MTTENKARAIGAAMAAADLAAGRQPGGVAALDMLHMLEIAGGPVPPEEYDLLVAFADGGYWSAIDEAIPARPDTAEVPALDDDGAPVLLDLSWVRIVPRRWREAMDETLLILLDEAADRLHWTAARFCAAYAIITGPASAGRIFGGPHENSH